MIKKCIQRLVFTLVCIGGMSPPASAQILGTQYVTAISVSGLCSAGACASFQPPIAQAISLDVSGTFSGTLTAEATLDGVNWRTTTIVGTIDGAAVTTTTAPGAYTVSNIGFLGIRFRATAWTSGTARITATAGPAIWSRLGGGTGTVTGPASAVSGNLASFNGVTGKIIQDSGVTSTTTGSGNLVLATSPTLTTPVIGVASGTSLTLSSLTLNRQTYAGTAGLLTDFSTMVYNPVYAGGGSNPALNIRPSSVYTNVGAAYILADLHGPGKGSFPLFYVENTETPASDMGAGDGGSIFKVRGMVGPTNTHVANSGGVDIYVTAENGNVGHLTQLSGASLWAQNKSAAVIDYIFGAFIFAQNSSGAAASATIGMLNPAYISFDGNGALDTTVGTITDMIGVRLTGAGITSATVTNRYWLYADAMAGAASSKDYFIYSLVTQPSLFTGRVGIGATPLAPLYTSAAATGAITPTYTGANPIDTSSLTLTSLAAKTTNTVEASLMSVNEVALTGTPLIYLPVAVNAITIIKSTDSATWGAFSDSIGGLFQSRYEGTGSIPQVSAIVAATYRGNSGNVTSALVGVDITHTEDNSATSGTVTELDGVRIQRPTGKAGMTFTDIIGLNIANQTPALGTRTNTPYAIKQIGTADLIFWGSKFSTYNNITTAGTGIPYIIGSAATGSVSSTQTNLINYTPPASAGSYRLCYVIANTSGTNTGTTTLTIAYTSAAGVAQSFTPPIAQEGSAILLTAATGASKDFDGCTYFSINNAAAAITATFTVSGTVATFINASLEQLN